MTLNITNDGRILFAGQPFLWAAFIPTLDAVHKPIEVTAMQIMYPSTFDTGAGVEPHPAGDWLVKASDGTFSVMSNADFAAQFQPKV